MKLDRVALHHNGIEITGVTYTPSGKSPVACAALFHGYTASKESMDLLACYLCSRGVACSAFDCRGHKLGGSGGRLTSPDQAVEDALEIVAWTRRRYNQNRCALVGHSMGGLVCLAVASQSSEVSGVAALSVGVSPFGGFKSTVGAALIKQRGDYVDGVSPEKFLPKLDSLLGYAKHLNGLPVVCIASRGDVLVKLESVRELARITGAEFAEVDGGHLDAPSRARGIVANWLEAISGNSDPNT